MKVLSIRQPWAWLIVNGHKDIENRTWPTKVRGEILVHAGVAMPIADYQEVFYYCWNGFRIELPPYEALQRGGIVGQTEIIDCVADHPSPWKDDDQWGFVLRNSKPLPFVKCKGMLGFFNSVLGVNP